MTEKYDRETNPLPTFTYAIIRMAEDINSYETIIEKETREEIDNEVKIMHDGGTDMTRINVLFVRQKNGRR